MWFSASRKNKNHSSYHVLISPFSDHVSTLAYIVAAEAILLGFQHYIVTLGTIVIIPMALVPQIGGGNVRLWYLLLDWTQCLCLWKSNQSNDCYSSSRRKQMWFRLCYLLLDWTHCCRLCLGLGTCCYWEFIYLCSSHDLNYPIGSVDWSQSYSGS